MTCDINFFYVQRGEVDSSELSPCEDCLFVHVLLILPGSSLEVLLANEAICAKSKRNWWTTNDNGQLAIEWMRGSPAPDAVLQLLSCKCARSCKLPECTCLVNGFKCTDMCKLQTCQSCQGLRISMCEIFESAISSPHQHYCGRKNTLSNLTEPYIETIISSCLQWLLWCELNNT